MIDAHPALKASSPQAPAIDMFLGDDFHHNGAFRLMYTFSWLAGNARPRAGTTETRGGGFDYGTPDGYRFFLDVGPVANINEKYFNYSVPTWNEYMDHPNYDEYWQRQNPLKHARNITHAVLNVAGWFDAEDFYGPLETYRAVERSTPANKNRIVIGPWLHGGWASMPGDALGDIRFGSPTAEYYRTEIELPFFKHHLKDQGPVPASEATVFETGRQHLEDLRHVAAQGDRAADPLLPSGGPAVVRRAVRGVTVDWHGHRVRRVHFRSDEARAVEHGIAHDAGPPLDGGGSAVCGRPAGRARLSHRAAD